MRGHTIGKYKIGFDYSGNETMGYVLNTETNEKDSSVVFDINFNKQEYDNAKINIVETIIPEGV